MSESGPLLFYAAVRLNPEELAARTSRAFLGVRMECAQCHDHPFDDKISQHDFWSFAAFFARISRPQGKMEMTSPVLQVRDNERGDVMIPESNEVVPPRLPESVGDLADDAEWSVAPAAIGRLADVTEQPAICAGDGQPRVGPFVRPRAGRAGRRHAAGESARFARKCSTR